MAFECEACGKDHTLHDEDVLQIVKLTQATFAPLLNQPSGKWHLRGYMH